MRFEQFVVGRVSDERDASQLCAGRAVLQVSTKEKVKMKSAPPNGKAGPELVVAEVRQQRYSSAKMFEAAMSHRARQATR
eukprot:4296202-Pleurochrysis_carterae.AAC.1